MVAAALGMLAAMKRRVLIGGAILAVVIAGFVLFLYQQHQSRAKFDNLDRALKAVEVGAASGVSHDVFREKVTALALEDRLLQSQISGKREGDLLGAYEAALEAWQDSLTVWDAYFAPESVEFRSSLREAARIVDRWQGKPHHEPERTGSDDMFYGGKLPPAILERYALASYDYKKPGHDPLEPALSLETSLHKIWQEAAKRGVAVELRRRGK
jgi:hypothetical protein